MKKTLPSVLLLPALALAATGGRLAGSKHDLSIRGPGPIRALSEENPCVFCHVPHGGVTNRPEPSKRNQPYESSTMRARPGAPTGASRICLSCHDGTIAVGNTRTRRIATTIERIPSDRRSNLGTDLRRSHPISFTPLPDVGTHPPAPTDAVRLDRNGSVQCTSCHDPHSEYGDPRIGMFLVKSADRSELCLSCHFAAVFEPPDGSHGRSPASFGEAQGNRLAFRSVAEAGCHACHDSHGADPRARLLSRPSGDDGELCLRCHGTHVTRKNIRVDLTKPYAHVDPGARAHDAEEGRRGSARRLPETSPGAPRHVTCADCHDPHAASDGRRSSGLPGALSGVWGIDQDGKRVEQVRFEYEVCFKCHGDSANAPQASGRAGLDAPRRAIFEPNLRLVFSPSSPSYHPVVAPGRNPDVPGLRPPWNEGSLIACGDCHGSDDSPAAGGSGPSGPHGSIHPYLLERGYATAMGTIESSSAYALCYKCHAREVLLSPSSAFPLHRLHVGEEGGVRRVNAPCSACHDAHGVSSRVGNLLDSAHLISFDTGIVKPGPGGVRSYRSNGTRSGSCNLTCHGASGQPKEHADFTYPVPR